MLYKILEQNGIEIENIDGAAFNNFVIAGKNCILKGVLDECRIVKPSSNSLIVSKGVMIIQGVRIKILEDQLFTLTSTPAVNEAYQIIAQIELKQDRDLDFALFIRPAGESLQHTPLFKEESGVYEVEVGHFVYTSDGIIESLQATLPVAYGTPETVGEAVDGLMTQTINGIEKLYLSYQGKAVGGGVDLPDADKGEQGVGIKKIESGTPTQSGEYTVTPITVTKTDGNKEFFNVSAKQGIQGEKGEMSGADGLTVIQDENGNNVLYLTLGGEIIGEGVPIPKGGGSGGGGSSNNAILTATNTAGWISKTVAEGADCNVSFSWSSTENGISTGNGTVKVTVGGAVKTSYEVEQGEVVINIGKWLSAGSNKIRVEIGDVYGNTRVISYSITSVAVSISSYFDGTLAYTGQIPFSYIPVGSIKKTVHFLIDGVERATQTVTVSGREQSYTIPTQEHGSHTFEVYFTGEVDGQTVESNHLYYDLICYEEGNTTPIIAVPFKTASVKQYSTVAIPYSVYTPNILTSSIELKEGTNTVKSLTVDRTKQIWSYKALNEGTASLSIVCGDTTKNISFTVTLNEIKVSAETENLELYLTSSGRSNNEENPLTWSSGSVNAELTNFNLASDGWKLDEDNNTVLRVSGDARVYIPFNIFGSDFRSTGKTIEFEFATRDVLNYDSVILSAWSGERGIKITAQKALLKSEQREIFTQYKENETVRIAFTVEKRAENRLLAIYINGIMSGVIQYPTDDDFVQTVPVGISIGSNDCTTDIYCIRVYSNNLTRYQILDNWIADTQNVEELVERYNRNNIFDDYGNITISKIPSYLPYMVVNVAQYSDLPQTETDTKIVSGRYVDSLNSKRSFTFENAEMNIQGTSSLIYPRKNYKIKFVNGFKINGEVSENYQLRPTSVPTNLFTFKADVASSEGANNVELVRLYEDTCPVKTAPQKLDSRVRQGIEGYPILMFYGEGEALKFLGKYNFNNDKATGEVFGFNAGDESWEVLQNNTEMVIWKDDNFEGDTWKQSFKARYPKDNTDTTKLQTFASWLKSTDTTAVDSEEEKAERLAKFKAEFADYVNVDAMLFNYIFTETFLMVDNRAKNAFPTRYDEDGKWLILPYDYDTAIGINNEGELKFGYELEDTDKVNGNNVYNGQDSVLYVNMRLAFADEIMAMYQKLRTGDIFSYEEIEKRFEEHQAVWGEAVFNEDARFKYIDPLINENNKTYLPMLQGAKAEQRKWWLYNRFRYLDSKYNAGDSLEDYIMLRSYAVADIEVTPYADIYATAKFDSVLVQKRALRKNTDTNTYTLKNPLSGGRDAVISIYSASQLSNIGDLSGLKVGMADFSKATKLSSLKVGNNTSGYDNPNLTSLTIGNLVLLRTLDVRNCSALTQAVDISGCTNIEHVYFDGTATTGVTLPNGGILKTLHLPATVTNLTLLNQKQLTDFVLPSYSNISTLRIENVSNSVIDTLAIINNIQANSRVRLVGVDWSMNSASEVLAVMDKLDTFRGLDENGNNLDKAVVSGTIHLASLTEEELAEMNERYPNITIDFDSLVVKVKFYNGETLLSEQTLETGATITLPATPTKESTAQFNYTFNGWSLDGVNVVEVAGTAGTENLTYYAVFNEELRYYTVRFLNNDGTVLQTITAGYGTIPVYTDTTPVDPSGNGGEFIGWNNPIVPVVGNTDYTATFKTIPKLAYTLNSDNVSYSVSGIGTVTDTDIVIPATYKGLPITKIGNDAFRGTGITSITTPTDIVEIGQSAFYQCALLKTVNLSEGIKNIYNAAFEYCSTLETITIPEGTEFLDGRVFANCTSLKEVDFPSTITSIGSYFFTGSKNLAKMIVRATTPPTCGNLAGFGWGNPTIYVPYGCGETYKSSTNWSNYASQIQELPPPPSLAYELGGNDTYYRVIGRGDITDADIVIPDTYKGLPVSYIHEAFKNDLTITSITIPSSIISISTGSFSGSTNIENIYYSGTLEQYCNMDWSAKKPAHNLYINGQLLSGHLVIPNAVLNLRGYAFANVGNITEYTAPSSWAMPSGKADSTHCFEGCPDLEKLNQSWAYIHNDMFAYCSKLKTIPQLTNTVVVYERAFMGTALESVTFGSSIQFINSKSFYDCPNLKTITIIGKTTPPSLAVDAFGGTTNLQAIYVPANAVNTYKSATNWSNYADIIQAIQ